MCILSKIASIKITVSDSANIASSLKCLFHSVVLPNCFYFKSANNINYNITIVTKHKILRSKSSIAFSGVGFISLK